VGTPAVTIVPIAMVQPRRAIDGVDGRRVEILTTAGPAPGGTARLSRAGVAGASDDAPSPVAS